MREKFDSFLIIFMYLAEYKSGAPILAFVKTRTCRMFETRKKCVFVWFRWRFSSKYIRSNNGVNSFLQSLGKNNRYMSEL